MVFTHRPDHQTREIVGVDELSQRRARSPDGEGLTLLLAQVASVDESGNNMAVIEMKVVKLQVFKSESVVVFVAGLTNFLVIIKFRD